MMNRYCIVLLLLIGPTGGPNASMISVAQDKSVPLPLSMKQCRRLISAMPSRHYLSLINSTVTNAFDRKCLKVLKPIGTSKPTEANCFQLLGRLRRINDSTLLLLAREADLACLKAEEALWRVKKKRKLIEADFIGRAKAWNHREKILMLSEYVYETSKLRILSVNGDGKFIISKQDSWFRNSTSYMVETVVLTSRKYGRREAE